MPSRIVAFILSFAFLTFGVAHSASAADKCDAVYKKYPIAGSCGKSQMCIQKNMENRKARIAAGCKAVKNYKY